MRQRTYYYRNRSGFSFIGILLFFLIGFILLRIIGGLYSFLWGAIPIMLILALIINRRVVTDHVSRIARSFDKGILPGLLSVALNGLGLPFVSLYLVIKAFSSKGSTSTSPVDDQEAYLPYEEIHEDTDDDILDLPPLEKREVRSIRD